MKTYHVTAALRHFWNDGIYTLASLARLATAFWLILTASGPVGYGIAWLLLWSISKPEWRR